MQRPPTNSANRQSLGSSWGKPPRTSISRSDTRPITQQGMGLKTSHGLNNNAGRVIQDKSYFLGEMKQRIQLILQETDFLDSENAKLEQESASYMTFDKRSKALSMELDELQGELGDYNLMFECLQKDRDLEDLIKETAQLKTINDDKRKKVEDLFFQRQKKDQMVQELEKQVIQERSKTDILVDKMDPKIREKYLKTKEQVVQLEETISILQSELGALEDQERSLKKKLEENPIKKRAADLQIRIEELKEQKQVALKHFNATSESENEKDTLLKQIKEDNHEISILEKRISEMEEQCENVRKMLKQTEQRKEEAVSQNSLNNSGGGDEARTEKLEELVKRDREIQSFLDEFPDRKKELDDQLHAYESNINVTLEHITKLQEEWLGNINISNSDDSSGQAKEALSELSGEELEQQHGKRLKDLQKLASAEHRIRKEIKSIEENIESMKQDIKTFENIDQTKKEIEKQKHENAKSRESLKKQRDHLCNQVKEVTQAYEKRKSELEENETYVHLNSLELKIRHQEANVYHLKQEIEQKLRDSDVQGVEQELKRTLEAYNNILIQMTHSVI